MGWKVSQGDAREMLERIDSGSVQMCVTSPPYFGLRDYGHDGQIGLEPSPNEYVAAIVDVFSAVRRVLRDDGTLWLNLGDSYATRGMGGNPHGSVHKKQSTNHGSHVSRRKATGGLKPKDLIGVPWRVALALQADGWYLRSDIIWAKPNPMPESVTDRPTKSHEHIFLLAKSARYYYDRHAVMEPLSESSVSRYSYSFGGYKNRSLVDADAAGVGNRTRPTGDRDLPVGRNRRTVWTVPAKGVPGAHFAVFPPSLIEPCILAGSREGDTVLDPFCGSGTTGVVCRQHGRGFIGIELNPEYVHMSRERIAAAQPLTMEVG